MSKSKKEKSLAPEPEEVLKIIERLPDNYRILFKLLDPIQAGLIVFAIVVEYNNIKEFEK